MAARIDSLQFVAFTRSPPKKPSVELWQGLFGSFPDNYQQLPMGGSSSAGAIEGFNLNIQVQANRLDVIVNPPEPKPSELHRPPYIDDVDKALALGTKLIKALAAGENVHRPAVVFQTSDECENIQEALRKVAARVPGLPYPPSAIDISYQLVVPRQSKVDPAITITRLGRWNTAKRMFLALGGPTAVGIAPGSSTLISSEYVDVYAAEQPIVGNERYDAVLDEIIAEAQDILHRGYDALT